MSKDIIEVLCSYRDYYGTYHHHKENMAFAGAGLYLAGAATLVFLKQSTLTMLTSKPVLYVLVICVLVISAAVAFYFVVWQFQNRHFAAGVVEACTSTIAEELKAQFGVSFDIRHGFKWPKPLVEALDEVLPETQKTQFCKFLDDLGLKGGKKSEVATYAVMVTWTVAAACKLMKFCFC